MASRCLDQRKGSFALVVGINEYPNFPKATLSGARNDAIQFGNFFSERFPNSEIITLLDEQASGSGILNALQNLAINPKIVHGDSIVIFFAGHGSQRKIGDRVIEYLVPSDDTEEESKSIPDHYLAKLINNISVNKGNNITLIVDCCHAGGINRDKNFKTRSIDLKSWNDTLWNDDPVDENPRLALSPPGWRDKNLESHVLIGACKAGQYAWEDSKSGFFTAALLDILQSPFLDISYTSLLNHPKFKSISRNPAFKQMPECNGAYTNRALFQRHTPDVRLCLFDVHLSKSRLFLNAGSAHGIWQDARFEICDENLNRLGVAEAQKVAATYTELITTFENRGDRSARILSRHPSDCLSVYFDDEQRFQNVLGDLQGTAEAKRSMGFVNQVAAPEESHLILSYFNWEFSYSLLPSFFSEWLDESTKATIRLTERTSINNLDDVLRIFRAASRFRFVLGNEKHDDRLQVHLVEYTVQDDLDREIILQAPDEWLSLTREGMTLNIQHEDQKGYGVALRSNHGQKLFPYVFLFNASDLSISLWYHPPNPMDGGSASADILQPGQLFHIPGDREHIKWKEFTLSGIGNYDVTWVKVYVTTRWTDLSRLCQESPFNQKVKDVKEDEWLAPRGRVMTDKLVEPQDAWGTFVCPIIQRWDLSQTRDNLKSIPRPKPSPQSTVKGSVVHSNVGLPKKPR